MALSEQLKNSKLLDSGRLTARPGSDLILVQLIAGSLKQSQKFSQQRLYFVPLPDVHGSMVSQILRNSATSSLIVRSLLAAQPDASIGVPLRRTSGSHRNAVQRALYGP